MRHYLLAVLFLLSAYVSHAQITVNGVVTSSDDQQPLPGVSIRVVGTSNGTTTNIDGEYTIQVDEEAELEFSFIGYRNQVIPVNGRSAIDVVMQVDIAELEEVIVVGYGEIKKSDLTGSVTSIKSEELVKAPSADPVQSLQGKVSGLQILNNSGQPGAEANVRLRGINTLNDNRVLYVVDGVIVEDGIGFLNSKDIESIEVLKDASAKAIFGTRGANGVIIVTTKQAKQGEGRISFSAEYGIENVTNPLDLMSGREFATLINEVNPGTYNNLDVLPNTDWQELVFQDWQPIQTYTLSASGASEKLKYYVSGGYFGQEGILPKSDFERITFKLNTTYDAKDYLKLGANITGVTIDQTNPPGVTNALSRAWPINEPFNSDGSFAEVQGAGNPLAAVEYSNSNTNTLRALGNFYAEASFLDGFKFKTSFQFNVTNGKTKSFTPEYYVAPLQQNEESDISVRMNESRSWIFENTLSYNKEFDRSTLNAVVGYSAQQDESEFISGSRQNLLGVDPSLWYLDAGAADQQLNSNGGGTSSITSILFRANYSYDSRYLATATFRRDGSSNFGRNNRFASFPAFALGWNLHNESFYPSDFIVNSLKLRASWGVNGNQRIGATDQYSLISSGIDAVFGNSEALNAGATYSGRPGNPDLKWETTTEYDIGLEFDLFQSRLTGEVDYYNRNTEDILVLLDLPGYLGAGAFVQKRFNAADVTNSGFEFVLNWQDEIGDFTYGIGFNGNTINNEVTNLGEDIGASSQIINGDLGNGQRVTKTEVGMPIGYFYGYKVAGVFQNSEQLDQFPRLSQQGVGDFIYEDANGDGELNDEDKTFIGSWIPDFVYGFSVNVGYKGVSLSADFAGQTGNSIYNGKQVIRSTTTNFETKFLDRWNGEGTSNTDPRASLSGINYQPSDYFVEDASFLKLRTVTLSYQLPSSILDRVSFLSANVFVRASNMFVLTDYSGYTPEIGSGSSALGGVIDSGVYPTTSVLAAGLNLTF